MNNMGKDELIEHLIKEIMSRVANNNRQLLAIGFLEKNLKIQKGININYYDELTEDIDIDKFDYIFLGRLGIKELASIATGIGEDSVSSLVIEGLLRGKKIFIRKDGVVYYKYKDTSNLAFYNIFREYENKLKSFGIQFIDNDDLLIPIQESDNNTNKEYEEKKLDYHEIQEKIITEAIVKKIFMNGYRSIEIKKNTIITPLARDYIRTNQIQLKGEHL